MNEEKMKILQMVQEGKITPTEALELLEALEPPVSQTTPPPSPRNLSGRFLRIRVVTDGITRVNVNAPMSFMKFAGKFANMSMSYIPESARQEMKEKGIDLSQIDFKELFQQLEEGLISERLVDVEIDDPTEGKVKVEIYVD